MGRLAVHAKQVVKPSGAVSLAGLARPVAHDGHPVPEDVGVILSGGNVDLDRWSSLVGQPDSRADTRRLLGSATVPRRLLLSAAGHRAHRRRRRGRLRRRDVAPRSRSATRAPSRTTS